CRRDEQTENIQAGFMGECGERGDGSCLFHYSNIMK
ncbi:MAG: hypothetical protein ACJAU5_001353, partial [Maricaulis maris]